MVLLIICVVMLLISETVRIKLTHFNLAEAGTELGNIVLNHGCESVVGDPQRTSVQVLSGMVRGVRTIPTLHHHHGM